MDLHDPICQKIRLMITRIRLTVSRGFGVAALHLEDKVLKKLNLSLDSNYYDFLAAEAWQPRLRCKSDVIVVPFPFDSYLYRGPAVKTRERIRAESPMRPLWTKSRIMFRPGPKLMGR